MSPGVTAVGLRPSGFPVATHHSADDDAVGKRIGVPPSSGSVHTATAADDVIEGHVSRPMDHRPPVTGLAVLGIAGGSSGRGSAPKSR